MVQEELEQDRQGALYTFHQNHSEMSIMLYKGAERDHIKELEKKKVEIGLCWSHQIWTI